MLSKISIAALVASCLLSSVEAATGTVVSIATPTTTMPMNALTSAGCFSTPAPMVDHGAYIFQSSGNCQGICYELGNSVMGLVNGTNCWCGNLLPPNITKVSNANCNTPCSGIDTDMCGGDNMWLVYLTGITKNKIGNLDPASLSLATQTVTSMSATAPATVVVTASSTPHSGSGGGASKVGIAVGVVVGIVAMGGMFAGVFFLLRHKRRREAEEEYKRQAAANSFITSKRHGSAPSINDSRLDPDMLTRRESTGTINDTQDYSRRILKVRNPDGY